MDEKEVKTSVIGEVSAEQIETWKGQHRKVFCIDVEDDGEIHRGYFHRPSLEQMAAAAKISKNDEVKGGTVLFDGCWLGGSEAMRKDTVLFLSAMVQLNKEFTAKMASLKKI